MKLTLRKTAKVVTELQEEARKLSRSSMIELTEYDDVEQKLAAARAEAAVRNQRVVDLYEAIYALREAVGHANAISGVSALMTKAAFIDKQIALLNDQDTSVGVDVALLQAKVARLKNATERSRWDGDSVSTSVYTQDDLNAFRKQIRELKKEKAAIQDDLLELNVNTLINVPEYCQAIVSEFA